MYRGSLEGLPQAPLETVNLTPQQLQFVVQLESISKPESPSVLIQSDTPVSLAYWQGREEEIAQIRQLLKDQNTFLIGIEGVGGIGKSTLVAKIYQDVEWEEFPKRFWADVSKGKSFTDLARKVLIEFGFCVPEQETELVEALVKCLRTGKYLLIIDNLESLLQADRQWGSLFYCDFFTAWIQSCSQSKILITTRERPELPQISKWLTLGGLELEAGVALLDAIGIHGNLSEFVMSVHGHPLLLKLVAGLLQAEYPQDPDLKRLADLGLDNLQQLLTDPQVIGQHRRENVGMALVLDTSFARLNEMQQALLQNISVYRGAVDSTAAVAVLPGATTAEMERELRNLVKRSLLSEKLNGKRWFEFQSVVLDYARYKAGEKDEAHKGAIDYYRSILKQSSWTTKDDVKEYLEIFYHFCQLHDYNSAFDTLVVCAEFLNLQGYYVDQVELYGQLVTKWAELGDRENWKYSFSLNFLGNACNNLGQYQQAIEFLHQSLEIAREVGDRKVEGLSLNNLANSYNYLGQYQQAIEFLHYSLEIAREVGDRNIECTCLNNLSTAFSSLEQYQQAIEFLQQSLEIAKEIGNRNIECTCLNNFGQNYNSLRQYQQAIEFLQQSLEIAREIGIRHIECACLNNLGKNYNSLRQYQQAIEFLQQSLEIAREIGIRHIECTCLNNLGIAYESLGEYHRAIEFYQHSLEIAREIGIRNGEGYSLRDLGDAYESLGEYHRAIEFYQQSLDIFRQIGNYKSEDSILIRLRRAYKSLGKYQLVIDFYQHRLKIARKIGDHNGECISLSNLGGIYLYQRQYQKAVELYQQSLEIAKEIGDRRAEQTCLSNLSIAYYSLEQYEKTIELDQQRLKIAREIGDSNGEGVLLNRLGNSYRSLGQYEKAIELHQYRLEISRKVGDRNWEGVSLNNLGNAYKSLRQYEKAIEFYQKSVDISMEIDDRNGEGISLSNLGDVYESLGQYEKAIEFYQKSLDIFRETGDSNSKVMSLSGLMVVYQKSGRFQELFAASYEIQQTLVELGLPLLFLQFYPKWVKLLIEFLIEFAQHGRLQFIVCFIIGLFAVPFFLVWLILMLLWRIIQYYASLV